MVLNNANSPSAPLLVPGRGCSGAHTPDHKLNIPLQARACALWLLRMAAHM